MLSLRFPQLANNSLSCGSALTAIVPTLCVDNIYL